MPPTVNARTEKDNTKVHEYNKVNDLDDEPKELAHHPKYIAHLAQAKWFKIWQKVKDKCHRYDVLFIDIGWTDKEKSSNVMWFCLVKNKNCYE